MTEQTTQTTFDILTRRGIPLELGDRTFRVRPRTIRQDRDWLTLVRERVTARLSGFAAEELDIPAIVASLGEAPDDMVDLIAAYDLPAPGGTAGELPPREWIEEHAFTPQITDAFATLLEEAYPPFAISRRLLPADRAAQIIGKMLSWAIDVIIRTSPEPTSSPSLSGDTEAPERLTTA